MYYTRRERGRGNRVREDEVNTRSEQKKSCSCQGEQLRRHWSKQTCKHCFLLVFERPLYTLHTKHALWSTHKTSKHGKICRNWYVLRDGHIAPLNRLFCSIFFIIIKRTCERFFGGPGWNTSRNRAKNSKPARKSAVPGVVSSDFMTRTAM